MDSNSFERASRAIGTWLSRRQLIKGIAVVVAGKGAAGQANAQGLPAQETPAAPVEVNQDSFRLQPTEPPVDQQFPTEPPVDQQFPTEPPVDQQFPTEPAWPTEPTWPTETPTSTPTETPTSTPTETPTSTPTEAISEAPPPPPVDTTRQQIAAICQAAADVLAQDVAEPEAFQNHPHPESAYGFLNTLNGVALWGTNAETWDDALLANYVVCGDTISHAVRVGADAYYEVLKELVASGELPESDPDTCIFEELNKWDDCIATCAPDDAVCRLTCFWNFTVLNSCRRCLRAF